MGSTTYGAALPEGATQPQNTSVRESGGSDRNYDRK
jgi:hypothetical protein